MSPGGFSAARKMFENSSQAKPQFRKPAEKPVKAMALPQYTKKPAETEKITATAVTSVVPSVGTKGGEPSWLTIAQVCMYDIHNIHYFRSHTCTYMA